MNLRRSMRISIACLAAASCIGFAPLAQALSLSGAPTFETPEIVLAQAGRPHHRPGAGRPDGVRPGGMRPNHHRPGRPATGAHRPRPGHHLHRPWRGRYWRPGHGWAFGSAIAIGVLSAAAAAAYAPPPPSPGLCWYYTDPSRRAGYWDQCEY